MHTYFIVRGIKDKYDRFIEDMEKLFVPFDYNGNKHMLQVAWRKVELWECVYPEAAHENVMRMVQPNDTFDYTNNPAKFVEPVDKRMGKKLNWIRDKIRWFLKLDKTIIPPDVVPNDNFSKYRQFVGVHTIGSKKDVKEIINEKV